MSREPRRETGLADDDIRGMAEAVTYAIEAALLLDRGGRLTPAMRTRLDAEWNWLQSVLRRYSDGDDSQ